MPYVTAIMCSTAARTGIRSPAPPASASTRSARGGRRCDVGSLRLTAQSSVPFRAQTRRLAPFRNVRRSEEHTSELQSQSNLVCRLLLEKKKRMKMNYYENDSVLCYIIIHSGLIGLITI